MIFFSFLIGLFTRLYFSGFENVGDILTLILDTRVSVGEVLDFVKFMFLGVCRLIVRFGLVSYESRVLFLQYFGIIDSVIFYRFDKSIFEINRIDFYCGNYGEEKWFVVFSFPQRYSRKERFEASQYYKSRFFDFWKLYNLKSKQIAHDVGIKNPDHAFSVFSLFKFQIPAFDRRALEKRYSDYLNRKANRFSHNTITNLNFKFKKNFTYYIKSKKTAEFSRHLKEDSIGGSGARYNSGIKAIQTQIRELLDVTRMRDYQKVKGRLSVFYKGDLSRVRQAGLGESLVFANTHPQAVLFPSLMKNVVEWGKQQIKEQKLLFSEDKDYFGYVVRAVSYVVGWLMFVPVCFFDYFCCAYFYYGVVTVIAYIKLYFYIEAKLPTVRLNLYRVTNAFTTLNLAVVVVVVLCALLGFSAYVFRILPVSVVKYFFYINRLLKFFAVGLFVRVGLLYYLGRVSKSRLIKRARARGFYSQAFEFIFWLMWGITGFIVYFSFSFFTYSSIGPAIPTTRQFGSWDRLSRLESNSGPRQVDIYSQQTNIIGFRYNNKEELTVNMDYEEDGFTLLSIFSNLF